MGSVHLICPTRPIHVHVRVHASEFMCKILPESFMYCIIIVQGSGRSMCCFRILILLCHLRAMSSFHLSEVGNVGNSVIVSLFLRDCFIVFSLMSCSTLVKFMLQFDALRHALNYLIK